MKVLIVGGGLIGVTSAYFLARQGWEVTVLERRDGAGQETSFANGGLLTPSMAEPWNPPGIWKVLLRSPCVRAGACANRPGSLRWNSLLAR